MKTIKLFFLATLLFSGLANAQITKGNWMVGGTGSFSSENVKDTNGNTLASGNGFRINPDIGFFFIDKLAGGIQLSLSYGKPSGNTSNFGYGIQPFVRYYFLEPEKLINVFAEASYGYNISKSEGQKSYYGRGYTIKAGPAIFFNDSVALELTANYNSSYLELTENHYNNFTIGIGFQIHLEKK
jgi:hypothetical protein